MSSNNQIPCPNCSNYFTEHNPPRKLINCSHLMCQRCLISQKCCKKCGANIGLNDHFLKDYIIMPLIVNHIKCHKKHTSIDKSALISPNKSQQNEQERIIRELHQKTEIQNFCNEEFVVQQCLLHSRPADLICVQDRAIICSSCALFGKHKGHQVTNRESILTKFASFIEDCLKIYDNLKQQNRLFSSQIFDSDYRNILQQKLQADQKRISTKFEQIITNLKITQKKQLLKLRQFYKQRQKNIKIKQQKIKKVQTQVKNWLTQIQNIGSLISDTTSLQKISNCIPFIDEKSKLQLEILQEGQNIMQKFIQIKGVYQDQLDLQKQTDYLIFDESKPKILQKYVSIKSTTIQPQSNLRNSLSLLHESPVKQKTPVKMQEPMNKKNKSTIKKSHMKTQSDAFHRNSINSKAKLISDFQTIHYVDDNLLLSVQQLTNSNKAQQNLNSKNVIIQRVQIAQQLDVQNIPHLSISDIKPANISSGQSSDQSRFLQRDRQLKQFINQDGLMGLTVQFSNNKQEQKKKKKIQFPEKFKGIVDDLKNDRAEIIDLTGAQVGDGSIMGLCPFIKKSKKLKTLKLIKNKLTDDCLLQLFQALGESKVCSLNLSQNLFTDKSCAIIQSCSISPNLKTITLSLNKINRRNVKSKIDEFSKKNIAILL